jgi:hypothetical protein
MPRETDPKRADGAVDIRDFGGFVTNADPHDVRPGTAVEQVNATSVRPGELRARPGTKVVQFD